MPTLPSADMTLVGLGCLWCDCMVLRRLFTAAANQCVMPFRHQITEDYIHILWFGELVGADLQALGALIPRLAQEIQRTPHLLHTFDEITGSALQPLDAFQHSLHVQDAHIPHESRSAVVVKHAAARPMANLFCALNRQPKLRMQIFESKHKAIAWLREARLHGPQHRPPLAPR